ncbi:hypothetical protein [Paenibacillus sp.]|uniref:hypothetical protein n=1 Tax=Paenibacillus sp. TaxID=58172 RepID=UPI0028112814|nr:hypothetical protein [Paenibacillus sp.]
MAVSNKFVFIIQANQQDVGKAVHGLLYGKELYDEGFEVEIVFDGAGTQWPDELSKANHPFHPLYKQVLQAGLIKGGCQACSGFFETETEMKEAGVPTVGNHKTGGHLPFAQYVKDGYFPIVL